MTNAQRELTIQAMEKAIVEVIARQRSMGRRITDLSTRLTKVEELVETLLAQEEGS